MYNSWDNLMTVKLAQRVNHRCWGLKHLWSFPRPIGNVKMGGSYQALSCTPKPTVVLLSRTLTSSTVSYWHLTQGLGVLSLRNALLEGKTQNSEVLMLGLCSWSFGGVLRREGGRKEGSSWVYVDLANLETAFNVYRKGWGRPECSWSKHIRRLSVA